MAFTENFIPIGKHRFFLFYATGSSSMSENLDTNYPLQLQEIRLHLSVVHASVVDFTAYLSSVQDSVYNAVLLSEAMNGLSELILQPAVPMLFNYNDTINFSMHMSAANVFGLTLIGWSIIE